MFFTGDPSIKKKVDLGGRSSKERDRNKLLEQARIDREKRQRWRLENQSAVKIQKFYRGWRAVTAKRQAVRSHFYAVYGEYGDKADRDAFKINSNYLPQLFFFYDKSNTGDFRRLAVACYLLQCLTVESGDVLEVFGCRNCLPSLSIAEHRVKKLSLLCLQAVFCYRDSLKEPSSNFPERKQAIDSSTLLLQTVSTLTDTTLPWAGSLIKYLAERRLFSLLRDILLAVPEKQDSTKSFILCLEQTVVLLALRHVEREQSPGMPFNESFATQILTIPVLFQKFPSLKQVFVSKGLWAFSIRQLALSLPDFLRRLPSNSSSLFPSHVCLLGNLLEISGSVLCLQDCPWQLAVNFASVARCLLEELPSQYVKAPEGHDENIMEENMEEDGSSTIAEAEPALEQQLQSVVDTDLLVHLVKAAFQDSSLAANETETRGMPPSSVDAGRMGEVCAFLYAVFLVMPCAGAMVGLAYKTLLVPRLWDYMQRCHLAQQWPMIKLQCRTSSENHSVAEIEGWMLPLSIFCPVYSFMLVSIDNEEFYEQQKPLGLDDLRRLVIILKEALWQLLWVMPSKHTPGSGTSLALQKNGPKTFSQSIFSSNSFRQKVSSVSARLLTELQDWNNRRQFTSPQDFHAKEAADEIIFTQVEHENPRARELLARAPFLVPFTHRVRIYTAQLSAARQHNSLQSPVSRIRVRRDRIVEDAFMTLNSLREEALQGVIRVTFVNELGVEEAGVDGGGLFMDFMENITKAAFDIQYGLFKETPDHLLYPNPASHMVHDEHLQYFEFLGKILGKAMFEGILVDIPFATFFLSKLKRKHNYLHDLPSLDPELYRSLLFLKRYDGDLTQLGLYFAIENNEYGEQDQVELLPGAKDIPVTNDNVIRYIHLVANHRLNSQIRNQSYHFLRGFQQLIQTKWIDMFNEHELQVLISGSLEGMNVDDLRSNAHYSGGYNENHPVIQMFWEVMKTFDSELQQKFLKFVTGCSRGPLLGFKYLEPQFCIQRAAPEDVSDEMLDRLPTSATCMNLLKLPPYKRKEVLREKLLYAINAEAGFDLS